jgi:2-hydroxychromene-2-carboxylate isomerase
MTPRELRQRKARMKTLDFHFDYRSPNNFPALSQVRKMDVEIAFHPFEIGNLMKQVGNASKSITCAPEGSYVTVDLWMFFGNDRLHFLQDDLSRAA